MPDTYRWTLDEYTLRCEDGAGLREILVESDLDFAVLTDLVRREIPDEVGVVTADYLDIAAEQLASASLSSGVRSELLTVVGELERRAASGSIAAVIRVVVDRDFDPPELESRFLCVTDGYSVENYALNAETFGRFATMLLGDAVSGDELLSRVMDGAAEMAGIRRALMELDPPVAPFDRWERYLQVAADGRATLDASVLIERVLQRASATESTDSVKARQVEAARAAAAAPLTGIRGHDFLAVLMKVLRSPWGRRLVRADGWKLSEDALARVLLMGVPLDLWRESSLLLCLQAAFA